MIERVLISMPEKFLKDVDDLACYENRSRSELIREALRVYMNGGQMDYSYVSEYVTEDRKQYIYIDIII